MKTSVGMPPGVDKIALAAVRAATACTRSGLALELEQLQGEAAALRIELAQIQLEVASLDKIFDGTQLALLLEENSQLLAAKTRAEQPAVNCALTLDQMSPSPAVDPLTDLPNRIVMLARCTQAIADAKRKRSRFALLFVALDNFGHHSSAHGQTVSDTAIKMAARCMSTSVREIDTVSRQGGDEFLILLADIGQASNAVLVANKIIAALATRQQVESQRELLKVSIGISIYPDDGEDAEILISRADSAMFVAKRSHLSNVAYHGELTEPTQDASPPGDRPSVDLVHSKPRRVEDVQRRTHLREANEFLILAALSAQELQAASELAQRRQAQLLSVIAHELRNPLMPIRTAATMLHSARSEDLPRMQAIIERQVSHMSRLIGDLVDDSRIKTGKLRLNLEMNDLITLIQQAIDAARPSMDARLQRIATSMSPASLPMRCDPLRIAQIISNLLDNASKYTPNGGHIECTVSKDNGLIIITVTDSGIGISADSLAHVFDPFIQDRHATGFNGEGLGLGLTVVRELVEAHGGSVFANSTGPGLGSRFVVSFPETEQPNT